MVLGTLYGTIKPIVAEPLFGRRQLVPGGASTAAKFVSAGKGLIQFRVRSHYLGQCGRTMYQFGTFSDRSCQWEKINGFVFAFSNLQEVQGMALEAQREVDCRGLLGLLSLLASHIVSIVAYNPLTYVIPSMLPVLFGFKVFGGCHVSKDTVCFPMTRSAQDCLQELTCVLPKTPQFSVAAANHAAPPNLSKNYSRYPFAVC